MLHARHLLAREIGQLGGLQVVGFGHSRALAAAVAFQVWVVLRQNQSRPLWGVGRWSGWDEAGQLGVARVTAASSASLPFARGFVRTYPCSLSVIDFTIWYSPSGSIISRSLHASASREIASRFSSSPVVPNTS